MRRSMVIKEHGALESCLTEFLRDLDGAAETAGVEPRLCGLFDDSANLDGQLGRSVEYEHSVVRQQHRRNPRGDRGPDVGHRLVGSPRTVIGHRYSGRQTEHGQGFDPTADRTVGDGEGGRVWRMRVQDTANASVVGVHRRVHGHYGTLDGWQVTLEKDSVQPDSYDGRMVNGFVAMGLR